MVRTNNHSQEETVKHVSMELPTVDVNISNNRNNNRDKDRDRNRGRNRQNRNRREDRRDNTENKNVTVRTFGKKKVNE